MPRQTNTKEKIISSAFLMYRKMLFKEFSLSDIAKASGISKTAIFRHFKNKAELVETMNERFFENFEIMVGNIQGEAGKRTLEATRKVVDLVCEFDKENPGFIEYYVQSLMCNKETASRMVEIMSANHLNMPKEDIFRDEKKLLPENLVSLYLEITILNFLIEGSRATADNSIENEGNDFRKKIADIIFEGLGKKKNPISAERRKELDTLCQMKLAKNENQDRFFDAFLNAIKNNVGFNITVEAIATELGMAKSSMYSFFENKTDYMKNMLRQETEFFGEILQEKCALAVNTDEMIYILIRSEVNYFMERPKVILMHSYFTYHDMRILNDSISEKDFKFLEKIIPENFNLGFGDAKTIFIKWISVLSVTLMFMGRKYNFPPMWYDFFISTLYEFIECGTKSCIKNKFENNGV